MSLPIIDILILAVVLALSIGFHEFAHARASNKLGDPTPKLQGRLTPNPLAHLDPLGFLLIFIIHFGRGKPVQINPQYYKKPRWGEFLVAMAGPASNIILMIVGIVFLALYSKWIPGLSNVQTLFTQFWTQRIYLNAGLAVFNLIPIPPLDGWKLIKLVVGDIAAKRERYLGTNPLILIALFVIIGQTGVFRFVGYGAQRLVQLLSNIINRLL
ncbi:MAG TPA: site-2 protease family protein [Candidatus Absconditabacterales bacterium]|nr:site-2 protease family protein [Candidatus Absconditabacterales bacterium]HNG96833.1 site-2 protease family protein [Candidatus Absconditabacterales bacterium]